MVDTDACRRRVKSSAERLFTLKFAVTFEGTSKRPEAGFDVHLEDLSAYRAVNTKWYLVHYLNADPKRILPTNDETYFAQSVGLYPVLAFVDFNHVFLGTTKTKEKPCTIAPCYSPDEETPLP